LTGLCRRFLHDGLAEFALIHPRGGSPLISAICNLSEKRRMLGENSDGIPPQEDLRDSNTKCNRALPGVDELSEPRPSSSQIPCLSIVQALRSSLLIPVSHRFQSGPALPEPGDNLKAKRQGGRELSPDAAADEIPAVLRRANPAEGLPCGCPDAAPRDDAEKSHFVHSIFVISSIGFSIIHPKNLL